MVPQESVNRCERAAAWEARKELGKRNGHWSEWHQRCCRLEEFLVGEAGLPGLGQLPCATQGARQPPSPVRSLASLLPDRPPTDKQTTHRHLHCTSTESRGSHHTVPCTHGLGAKP